MRKVLYLFVVRRFEVRFLVLLFGMSVLVFGRGLVLSVEVVFI